jgi:gamma-glutamylcyclotransferase (GGCT)/AIG2-like uncharacterized protein YtfP
MATFGLPMRVLSAVPADLQDHQLYDSGYGWPFATPDVDMTVHGTLLSFEFTPTGMSRMDDYEAYDPDDPEHSLFVRTSIPSGAITRHDSGRSPASTSVYLSSGDRIVGVMLGRGSPLKRPVRVTGGSWKIHLARGLGESAGPPSEKS